MKKLFAILSMVISLSFAQNIWAMCECDTPAGSATEAGLVEFATDAETVTGSATDKATTPANITAKMSSPGPIGDTDGDTGNFTTLNTGQGAHELYAMDQNVTTDSDVVFNTINGSYTILTDTDIADDNITVAQASLGAIIFGDKAGSMDYNLPAAAAGLSVRLKVTTDNTGTLDSIGDDIIHLLDGTAITAANAIDLDGTAGSYVWLVAKDATNWWVMGQVGAVIDGGAD